MVSAIIDTNSERRAKAMIRAARDFRCRQDGCEFKGDIPGPPELRRSLKVSLLVKEVVQVRCRCSRIGSIMIRY